MTTTLGRATIGDPHGGTIRQQGNRLSFTADIEGTSVDDCQAKMQQLAGMLDNPDEEVFPFTVEDGWVTLPERPGLGVEPDLARLARFDAGR